MAQVQITLDTTNPEDLAMILRAFGSAGGAKSLTLDPDPAKKTKATKTVDLTGKSAEDTAAGEDDKELAGALAGEKVDRDACLALAKTKTGIKELLARMNAPEGKLSNLPDDQLGEFYKQCKALPNK